MQNPIHNIVYISSATKLLTEEELINLLDVSRIHNEKFDITGLLLYKDGNFMQVLEGDEQQVETLMQKIFSDSRHNDIITLVRGSKDERDFADWSMAFYNLTSPKVKSLPAYSEFLNTPLTEEEFRKNPSLCQKLLISFKKNMR